METKSNRRRRASGWIGFPSLGLWGALKLLDWLFSLGGASGNAEGWRAGSVTVLNAMPDWFLPVLLALGLGGTLIYFIGVVPEWYGRCRRCALEIMNIPGASDFIGKLVFLMVVFGGFGMFLYWAIYIDEPTRTAWTHPTFSEAEQEREKAECEMAALSRYPKHLLAHYDYVNACNRAKGFKLIKVPNDES